MALCAFGAVGYTSAAWWIRHTLRVQKELDEWEAQLEDEQSRVRAYIATGERSFIDTRPPLKAASSRIAVLRELVADNPPQVEAVIAAGRDAESVIEKLRAQIALVDGHRRLEAIAALASGEGQRQMDTFRASLSRARTEEERILASRRVQARSRAWTTLSGAALLAVVAFGMLLFAVRRERNHQGTLVALGNLASRRLESLSELAAALSAARSRAQVAEVVVEHGLSAAAGDTCTLYGLSSDGRELELLGHRGVDATLIDRIGRIGERLGSPETFKSFEAGKSVWAENEADYAALYPDLAKLKVPGRRARAFWSVPLVAEGSAVGLLGVGFYEPRSFSADERAFVATLANQCAQALLRAARLEKEDEARQWVSTTLRSIGDAVIATDAAGRIAFMNPVAERLTAWSEADAIGQPLDVVFHILSEHTRRPVENPVTKVLREGKVVGLANHTVLAARTGREVPIDDSGAPIRGEDGRVVGVVLVFRDVSEKKREAARTEFLAKAGEALVSSPDYEVTLATVANCAVPELADWCVVDLVEPNGSGIQQVAIAHVDPNKARFARELGERYPPDPDAPTGVAQVIRSGKSELYADLQPELVEAAAKDAEHLRILRELELVSAMVVPLRARTRIFGAMVFVQAESRRRYTSDDLAFAEDFARRAAMAIENSLAARDAETARKREQWLREQAERANRLKDAFLATVSHELRTPLNAILGWTVILRGGNPSAEVERALTVIERNARSQAKLIDDMLDVSRIVSGKLSLRIAPTNVASAAQAAIETVMPAASAKDISIEVAVPLTPLMLMADADRLQQIIWNLLSNAVKFTPKNGRVALGVKLAGSDVIISVTDTGEGIRPEFLSNIFEPFQQADSSTTRHHGGLGLGLSIVKHLVAAHGGSATAESAGLGTGAKFVVQLPVRAVAITDGCDLGSSAAASAGQDSLPIVARDTRLAGLRVLVVDDDEDARILLKYVLGAEGAEVHLAGSATEALERFTELRPDVLISDIGMPGEDGYALMKKIRAQPAELGGGTPAAALTAYAGSQDAQLAFMAGFQHHISKPVEPATLVSVVANLGGRTLEGSS